MTNSIQCHPVTYFTLALAVGNVDPESREEDPRRLSVVGSNFSLTAQKTNGAHRTGASRNRSLRGLGRFSTINRFSGVASGYEIHTRGFCCISNASLPNI